MANKVNLLRHWKILFVLVMLFFATFFLLKNTLATPAGPDIATILYNSTKPATTPKMVNLSGGYIGFINVTANMQDIRWKGFVGNVSGSLMLADASGSKIYDWQLVTTSGRIYATRNSTSVSWTTINCSNQSTLDQENAAMNHTNSNDNITKTFNGTGYLNHNPFTVGSISIPQDSCPGVRTYVNSAAHNGDHIFEEEALYDGFNIVYTTTIETTRPIGYNGANYNFQMIVPENGLPTFTGATAYYLYIELGTS